MSLLVERRGEIVLATLDRPHRHNALDLDLVESFLELLEELRTDPDARVLLITGRGDRAFSAGADMRFMADLDPKELARFLARVRRLFKTLAGHRLPSIALINGHAHGGGAEIACCCDLRIGCERASFRFPGVMYGMAVGSWHLATLVGLPKAKELLLTGRDLGAQASLDVGLLNQLTSSESLEEVGRATAAEIAAHPPDAVQAIKALLDQGIGTPLVQRFYRELYSNRERGAGATAQRAFQTFAKDRSSSTD
ncbi:MAG: enoyl-CoA hydratase/isomerase family protein [Acidobacteriota bacterium]